MEQPFVEERKKIKVHSSDHVLRKTRRNIPNEDARRKIVAVSLVSVSAEFSPDDPRTPEIRTFSPEINDVYEIILFNERVDKVIKDLDAAIQQSDKSYKDARSEFSKNFAGDGLKRTRDIIYVPPENPRPLYTLCHRFLAPVINHPYQFPIRFATLGKHIEGIIRKSEAPQNELKEYLFPDRIDLLPTVRRDLYDRLKRDRANLIEILTKL